MEYTPLDSDKKNFKADEWQFDLGTNMLLLSFAVEVYLMFAGFYWQNVFNQCFGFDDNTGHHRSAFTDIPILQAANEKVEMVGYRGRYID